MNLHQGGSHSTRASTSPWPHTSSLPVPTLLYPILPSYYWPSSPTKIFDLLTYTYLTNSSLFFLNMIKSLVHYKLDEWVVTLIPPPPSGHSWTACTYLGFIMLCRCTKAASAHISTTPVMPQLPSTSRTHSWQPLQQLPQVGDDLSWFDLISC